VNGMDRQLRDLLDAAVGEPPPDLVSVEAVRRRVIRRRVMEFVAGGAAAAVIAAAVLVGIGVLGRGPGPSAAGSRVVPTVYVCNDAGTVTPITIATNTAGKPIKVGGNFNYHLQIAITPDGKTAYVADPGSGTVTPITTATNTAGKPISVGRKPPGLARRWMYIAITPDGKTAYVTNSGPDTTVTVTPITIATNTAGKPISVARNPPGFDPGWIYIAITPDGSTAYVANPSSGTVIPITTATNTAGKPIKVGYVAGPIAITPDGKTAYVADLRSGAVIPITTATNTAGKPIKVGYVAGPIAITPDGKTAYVGSRPSGTVIPITTATNTAGKPISVGGAGPIAITPDGKTAYVTKLGSATVIPITTATNTAGKPISTASTLTRSGSGFYLGQEIAITPDGKTAYVDNIGAGMVIPITTATNTAGKPIKVGEGGFPPSTLSCMAITP
jgi:YVTN family beta-propeller protein